MRRPDVRVSEYPVQRRQHGDLDDQRKAAHQPAQRVDAVLLVELHHLGVQLLRVLAVLLLQLRHLGRELSLFGHRASLGQKLKLLQRRKSKPDEDGHRDDRHPVGADRVDDRQADQVIVNPAQQRAKRVLDHQRPELDDRLEDVEDRAQIDGLISPRG